MPVAGTLAPDGLSWTTAPNELGYGKTYTITAATKNVAGAANEATSSFTTVVPDNKTAASTFPTDGMTVGIAQPIAIIFDEPIADRAAAQQAITVTTTPGAGRRLPLDQRPGGALAAGRVLAERAPRWRSTVDIYGKDLGDGVYGQQDLGLRLRHRPVDDRRDRRQHQDHDRHGRTAR